MAWWLGCGVCEGEEVGGFEGDGALEGSGGSDPLGWCDWCVLEDGFLFAVYGGVGLWGELVVGEMRVRESCWWGVGF